MPAHVTQPAVAHPIHWESTNRVKKNISKHHRDHPKLATWLRIINNTGIQQRAFANPIDSPEVSGRTGAVARNTQAWKDAKPLAERAATQALEQAGLRPGDVDAIITSHTTSWAVPQMDVHLTNRLGLRPDVRRLALTTVGCVGGAKALAQAADHLAARPGSRVLVVVAEVISTTYHHGNTNREAMIYKALFGDSAAACIVTDTPLQPGLRIDDNWEYLLPNSVESSYWGEEDEDGKHFASDPEATKAPGKVMPVLKDWLKQHDALVPDFALIHAGGPAILNAVQQGLALTDVQLAHSWGSLAAVGNLGGASVLDVLRRTHDTPPANGDRGVMLAYGPGFATTALTGTWVS